MSESNITSENNKKSGDKIFPRKFVLGTVLLSIAVFVGIPGVLLSPDFLVFGMIAFSVAIGSLVVFVSEYRSSKRKDIISGTCVIISLLSICLVVFCSIHSMVTRYQKFEATMNYHIMHAAYCIEKERSLTGQYPGAEIYKKYPDIMYPGSCLILYKTVDEGKDFEIEGDSMLGFIRVFNSQYSELGVVDIRKIPKDSKGAD